MSADGLRVIGFLLGLAQSHDVEFLGMVEDLDRQSVEGSEVAGALRRVTLYGLRRQRAGVLGKVGRWVTACGTRIPPEVRAHRSRRLARRLRRTAGSYDAVIFLDNAASVHWRDAGAAPQTLIDVHHVAGWSLSHAPRRTGIVARLHQELQQRLMLSFERRSLSEATAVVVTSDVEADKLREVYDIEARAAIPSAIERVPATTRPGVRRVGWLGNLGYPPNRDGLLTFLDRGWPQVAEAGAELLVAGAGGEELSRATRAAGVRFLGFVDDLHAFLCSIDVAVVPIWAGAGMKLKTGTFLAAGVPLVSTPDGAEGVSVRDGEHLLIGQTPEDLAAAVGALLNDPARATALADRGRKLAEETLTWEAVGSDFRRTVEAMLRR